MRSFDAIFETTIGLAFIACIVYAATHPIQVLAAIFGGLYN